MIRKAVETFFAARSPGDHLRFRVKIVPYFRGMYGVLPVGSLSMADLKDALRQASIPFQILSEGALRVPFYEEKLAEYSKWERNVTDCLSDLLQIDNGDAQGILEAHPNLVLESWQGSLSPSETAAALDEASISGNGN